MVAGSRQTVITVGALLGDETIAYQLLQYLGQDGSGIR